MPGELAAAVYWVGMLVLFFFWAYGLVSFALDLKNEVLPRITQYRRGRRRIEERETEESERDEKEQQLY